MKLTLLADMTPARLTASEANTSELDTSTCLPPSPYKFLSRQEARLVQRAQTRSLPTLHVTHYLHRSPSHHQYAHCSGYFNTPHVLWDGPRTLVSRQKHLDSHAPGSQPHSLLWLATPEGADTVAW